tara:strand:+ start:68 stop:931 length:864 start_codon:yes stop_codon:yes gene_type:complete
MAYKKLFGLANKGTTPKSIVATASTQVLVTEGAAEIDVRVTSGIAAVATLPVPSKVPGADIVPGQYVRVTLNTDAADAADGVESTFKLTPAGADAIIFQDKGDTVLLLATEESYIIIEDSRRSIVTNQAGVLVANNTSANLDLTSTANNYANGGNYNVFCTGTLAAQIRLPQATQDNTGMHIRIMNTVDCATDGSAKIILENAGSTVMRGAVTIFSTTADQNMTRQLSSAKSIELDADAADHAGGAAGSVYDFYYVAANSIFADIKGVTTNAAPALDGNEQTTTGFS